MPRMDVNVRNSFYQGIFLFITPIRDIRVYGNKDC